MRPVVHKTIEAWRSRRCAPAFHPALCLSSPAELQILARSPSARVPSRSYWNETTHLRVLGRELVVAAGVLPVAVAAMQIVDAGGQTRAGGVPVMSAALLVLRCCRRTGATRRCTKIWGGALLRLRSAARLRTGSILGCLSRGGSALAPYA
jgi:hypothetical protein